MINNKLFSIVCGILVWTLGVGFYLGSFYLTILENPEQQANLILIIAIIPIACLGTYLFYKKGQMKPSLLALIFVITAVLLDTLITVPVFVIPAGGSYLDFFKNPMFYAIISVFYLVVLYYGNYLTKKIK